MNRFLYAHANPTTLIDPSGHAAQSAILIDGQCGSPTSCGTLKPQVNVGPPVTPEYTSNGSKSGNSGYTYSSNGGKKSPQTPKPFNVYLPNPSNLPWVGMPDSTTNLDRLGRVLAASEAARQIDAAIPPEVLAYGLAIFGGASLTVLLVRAGHTAATIGLGNACAIYCDDVAVAAEGLAGAPASRIPTVQFSRSRAPNIAANIDEAVEAGAPVTLTRATAAERNANRRAALQGQQAAPAGQSLDEYPFACTAQGGSGACVRAVPIAEQSYQGGVLSAAFRHQRIEVGDEFLVVLVE